MSVSREIPHVSDSDSETLPVDAQYVIPSERMPGALAALEIVNGFLDEIEALGLGTEPPRMTFDPAWDIR